MFTASPPKPPLHDPALLRAALTADAQAASGSPDALRAEDAFIFSTALGNTNVDRIVDFSVVDDTVRLDDAVFTGLTAGVLSSSAFAANLTGVASNAFQRVVYETDTGFVFFDADGSGAGLGIHFATLNINLALTNADFAVF